MSVDQVSAIAQQLQRISSDRRSLGVRRQRIDAIEATVVRHARRVGMSWEAIGTFMKPGGIES